MAFGGNIGLPTVTRKFYKTEIRQGHEIRTVNKSWHGTNVGWDVWVDGRKHFCNLLTREEAIKSVLSRKNPDGVTVIEHKMDMEQGWPVNESFAHDKVPKEEGSGLFLHISLGNDKIGMNYNVSLLPVKTCLHNAPCKVGKNCYAVRSLWRKTVRTAWGDNTRLAATNLPLFFRSIAGALARRHALDIKRGHGGMKGGLKDTYFRWHVAGDIPNQTYLENMKTLARAFPAVHFLCFTKMFTLDYSRKPDNLEIVFSMWPGWGRTDINIPGIRRSWLYDQSYDPRIPNGKNFLCPGECPKCGRCWRLSKDGEDVVFIKHPVAPKVAASLLAEYNRVHGGARKNPMPKGAGAGIYKILQPDQARPFVPKHWR